MARLEKEIDIAHKIFDRIQEDHLTLAEQLKKRESWWVDERARREVERIKNLADTQLAAEAREIEIKPERERLALERTKRIEEAESKMNIFPRSTTKVSEVSRVQSIQHRLASDPREESELEQQSDHLYAIGSLASS